MQFPFTYELKVNGVAFAQLEGTATVESVGTYHAWMGDDEWMITGLTVEGFVDDVEVPTDHPLHKELMEWLMKHKEREIDDAWAEYVAECRAEQTEVV
jgi:hypothetical protein